jgi:murein DD-endopeptidase MepM/ murein hydrolase activator NlpD
MSWSRAGVLLLVLACVGASVADAQTRAHRVTLSPRVPRAGTLFRVVVHGVRAGDRVTGTVAGEPLHFVGESGDTRSALAAAPVDATVLKLEVAIHREGQAIDASDSVSVASGQYPTERLSVAPRFGSTPDSALQARTEREARRAADVSRASHETPQLWTDAFVAPRASRVTSGYGRARVFNGAVQSRHMGTDYAGAVGAPVKAVNRGVVRIVDSFYYGGNVIYVDHGGGLVTAYLHLSDQAVAVGDTVEKGQVIGKVGSTGRVTGPHLHLIVRYGNVTVDPLSLLALTRK